jgi:hypothetical protein
MNFNFAHIFTEPSFRRPQSVSSCTTCMLSSVNQTPTTAVNSSSGFLQKWPLMPLFNPHHSFQIIRKKSCRISFSPLLPSIIFSSSPLRLPLEPELNSVILTSGFPALQLPALTCLSFSYFLPLLPIFNLICLLLFTVFKRTLFIFLLVKFLLCLFLLTPYYLVSYTFFT